MPIIFAVACFCGAVTVMIFVRSLDVAAGVKAAMILPPVLLVVYSLARIPPRKPEEKSRQ
jgi:hypothetical protein